MLHFNSMNPLWAEKCVYYLRKIIPIVDEMGVKVKLGLIILFYLCLPCFTKCYSICRLINFRKKFEESCLSQNLGNKNHLKDEIV